ncbi:MAG: antitoxin [Meiothermus sp.]
METHIEFDLQICNGRPVIRGTRIAVQTILEFLGAGDSSEEIPAQYPRLTRRDILAAVRYSSQHR